MGSTRFFLADLPQRTTERDLRTLFQDYGDVERVELKTKEQFVDSGQTQAKIIAFVTVYTEDAQYCLNELNWQKLHGAKLRVSLAKESFLDRLKRERDEGQQSEQTPTDGNEYSEQPSSRLLAQNTQNKRRVFGEDEEIQDDEIAPELMITKKRAANSIHNGKIVIQQEHDVKPLHIIEQHKQPKSNQNLDAKAAIADQKRKESLNKMKQQHQQKKLAIQSALSATESGSQAKRIKFSDAEEDEEEEKPQSKKKQQQPKMDLFDDDDGEDEDQEVVLPQYSGKKGERLVEMQSKQSLDPRFRITANFVGDEEGEDGDEDGEEEEAQQSEQAGQVSERNWQMGILEQVIGRKIDTANAPGAKASKNKKMLRFDPAKEEHQKLLRTKPTGKVGKLDKDESKTKHEQDQAEATQSAPVSQSAFYVVTDTLKESLKMRGEGFSLLDMFGSSHDEAMAERKDQLEKLGHEKVLVNKSNKLGLGSVNPFSYDSSDSEEEAEQPESQTETATKENEAPAQKKGKQPQKKKLVFTESFFIPKNDPRLKEGAKLFKSSKPELENENYDEVKKRLKLLITKKIAKSQKNLPTKKSGKKNKNKK